MNLKTSSLSIAEEKFIITEQLRLLNQGVLPVVIGNLCIALIIFLMNMFSSNGIWPVVWFAVLIGVLGARYFQALRPTDDISISELKEQLAQNLVLKVCSSTIWGCAILFSFYGEAPLNLHWMLFLLGGIAITSVPVSGLEIRVLSLLVLPMTIPIIIALLLSGVPENRTLITAIIPFVLCLVFIGHSINRKLLEGLKLRFKNDQLLKALKDSTDDKQKTMENVHFLLDEITSAVVLLDQDFNHITWNDAYEKIFNFPTGFLSEGMKIDDVIKYHYAQYGRKKEITDRITAMRVAELHRRQAIGSHNILFKNLQGHAFDVRIDYLENGNTVLLFTDVTHHERASTEALVKMAYHDGLTSLPNRQMFRHSLKNKLLSLNPEKEVVCVVLIDIDRFKDINDHYGHATGDQLIQKMADRLKAYMGSDVFIARLGGDEFAIVASHTPEEIKNLNTLAKDLIDQIRAPFLINGKTFVVEASIGLVFADQRKMNADQVIRNADIALRKAKDDGRNRFVQFEPSMHSEIQDRNIMLNELRDSMETSQFILHYQPQINLKTRQVSGMEALMRWKHPEKGWIAPDQFIPIAELSRQIIPLTEQLLPEACIQASIWRAQGLEGIPVSVNISPLHFHEPNLVDFIRQCIDDAQMDANMLELEITEGIVMSRTEEVINKLSELSDLGVRMAIDDFGTGYSSLTYLSSLPVSKLKIDQTFVKDMMSEKNNQSLVEAIVRLGHSFDLSVIAEGIEDSEQLEMLMDLKCDQGQGYYICRPMQAERVTEWIRENYR